MIKRLTSVAVLCALLSCFLMIPAKAALVDGTATFSAAMVRGTTPTYTNWTLSGDYSVDYSTNTLTKVGGYEHNTTTAYYRGMGQLTVPLSDVQGTVTVACSYFLYGSPTYNTFYSQGDLVPVTSWYDSNKNTQSGEGNSLTFTVTGDPYNSSYSTGVTISGVFEGTELNPISDLVISWCPSFCYGLIKKNGTQNIAITSFRVITSDASSATAAQLEEIAKGIAESNNILSAMYGDILAVCNSIYERNGSILEAQQLTNQYFQAIIPLLNNISSTTSNIYSLLSTQFSLLISTIQSESDDIQSAIDAAIDKMIAYLDNVFENSVNPALPGQSSDISSGTTTIEDSESGYQSTASERFDAISAEFTGFSGGVLDGVALAGNLFQRLWNVLGVYNVVYTVPLTLAIILTILGRLDRRAKKDDGSESYSPDPPNVPRLPK